MAGKFIWEPYAIDDDETLGSWQAAQKPSQFQETHEAGGVGPLPQPLTIPALVQTLRR